MTVINRSALLPYSAAQLFELVCDVAATLWGINEELGDSLTFDGDFAQQCLVRHAKVRIFVFRRHRPLVAPE